MKEWSTEGPRPRNFENTPKAKTINHPVTNPVTNQKDQLQKDFKNTRFWGILVTTWVGYIAYTIGRRLISVARSAIQKETNMSAYSSSMVDTCFLITYSIGNLSYGTYIKGTASSRVILAAGLAGSALCCLTISLVSDPIAFIIIWGLNGAFQSVGWASCVSILTPWLGSCERGVIMGLWGTNMAVGGVAANIITGALLDKLHSWREAIVVDVVVLFIGVIIIVLFLKKHPNAEGYVTPQQQANGVIYEDKVKTSTRNIDGGFVLSDSSANIIEPNINLSMGQILRIPGIAGLTFSYFFQKLVRYTLLFWLPYLFIRELKYSNLKSGYVASLLDIGGIAGTIFAGYFSDWYGKGHRRATCTMYFIIGMVLSIIAFAALKDTMKENAEVTCVVSFICGFCTFAIDSLMTGSFQQDITERQGVSQYIDAISGLVGGVGSIGTVFQGTLAAYLSNQSWEMLFITNAVLVVIGGVLLYAPLVNEYKEVSSGAAVMDIA